MNRAALKSLLPRLARNRFFRVALLFILGGVTAGVRSILSLVRFFRANMPVMQDFTVRELILGVVAPHLGLLFCILLIGYGVFLLQRSDIWHFLIVVDRES